MLLFLVFVFHSLQSPVITRLNTIAYILIITSFPRQFQCFPESEKAKITRQRYQFADDRQRDSTTSSATAAELSRIASLVESRLVGGSCAKDYAYSRMGLHDEDNEHPSMFIEEVYATYGVSGFMNASGSPELAQWAAEPRTCLQIERQTSHDTWHTTLSLANQQTQLWSNHIIHSNEHLLGILSINKTWLRMFLMLQ